LIANSENSGIGICTISLWEVAKLVEIGRLVLPVALNQWFVDALNYPGVTLLHLSPEVATESTRLPGDFHRDPADQIIVATARIHGCSLVTADQRIRDYPHVTTP
jgi:PIN domain nuclease of toxin-antitoxin system